MRMSRNSVVARPLLFQMRMSAEDEGRLLRLSRLFELSRSDTLRWLLHEACRVEGIENAPVSRISSALGLQAAVRRRTGMVAPAEKPAAPERHWEPDSE